MRLERVVERGDRLRVGLRERADDDAARLHEVANGAALGEELRVRDVADVREPARVEGGAHLLAGADRDGALHHEQHALLERRQLVDHRPDRRQVGVAGVGRRRADADEEDRRIGDVVEVEREGEALAVALEQLLEAGLVQRHAAGLKCLDSLGHDVADDDLVAQLGEAGAGHEPDPAGPEDADFRLHGRGAYRGSGRSPRAIASIVSFESESSSVFTTQYVAPLSRSTTMCSWPPL